MENNCTPNSSQKIAQLVDFLEARYNFQAIPYTNYLNRVTNVILGDSTSSTTSSLEDAPFNNKLYGRKNKTWIEIASAIESITNIDISNYNEAFSWGDHATVGYLLSETDPTVPAHVKAITTNSLANFATAFGWGNHALAGYALVSNLHTAVTLSNISNGLTLIGQIIGLNLATTTTSGAMSASDKVKLNNLTIHDAVTLSTSNGLSLSGQVLSLNLATNLVAGAMSASDKIKLTSLQNYTHPTGFISQPNAPLGASNVISQITVNAEGHVTGVQTRALTLSNLGVIKGNLTRVNDTNITLTLGGTPVESLFNDVILTLGWDGILSVERGGTGLSTFTAGQVLIGNGTGTLTTLSRSGIDTRTSFPPQAHTLTSHSDVSLTNPQAGQILVFQGGIWVNSTLSGASITLTETDPIFIAWRDTVRSANQFYSAPNGTNGIASFRSILREDIPNIYVRFDTNAQGLNSTQKTNVLTNIGAQSIISTTDVIGDSVIGVTNGSGKVIGPLNLTLAHAVSGWVDKTTLTGATIISNLTVNATGHISNWTTRTLTLADLGFVEFNPTSLEAAIADHETRIDTLETNYPLLNGDKNFVFVQAATASIWNITHNMNKKPSVTIIDSAGSMVFAKLTYVNLNVIQLDFDGQLTSGEAILN